MARATTAKTKPKFHQKMASKMNETECRVKQMPKQVQQKMAHLKQKFTETHDLAADMGQGVLKRDGQVTFQDTHWQRCPHHFELLPVMDGRGKACPKVTADALQQALPHRVDADSGNVSTLSDDDWADLHAPTSAPCQHWQEQIVECFCCK